ncbi:hypothetical protein BDN72DRAFT_848941 [Pluteus cervinus]|uniref:Uncharacterized protein n=1 Tax=Pluteus cervinus TaxID=181527 RepID=A0ACD3A923_9AGAR|nr:hypothetical protein BDN72DRAFT_848941 [Pluteus cervinus]
MSGDYAPFEFPLELEQEIFAFAFRQNRFDALNLLLVSKTVFGWIIPLLYEVVLIGAGSQISEDQIKEYGHHVRHLHVQGAAGWAAYCPHAFDIALWLRPTPNEIEDILELPITQLSAEIHVFFNRTPKMLAFCSRITHLDITTESHWDPREIIPPFLGSIPRRNVQQRRPPHHQDLSRSWARFEVEIDDPTFMEFETSRRGNRDRPAIRRRTRTRR